VRPVGLGGGPSAQSPRREGAYIGQVVVRGDDERAPQHWAGAGARRRLLLALRQGWSANKADAQLQGLLLATSLQDARRGTWAQTGGSEDAHARSRRERAHRGAREAGCTSGTLCQLVLAPRKAPRPVTFYQCCARSTAVLLTRPAARVSFWVAPRSCQGGFGWCSTHAHRALSRERGADVCWVGVGHPGTARLLHRLVAHRHARAGRAAGQGGAPTRAGQRRGRGKAGRVGLLPPVLTLLPT